MDDHNGLDPQNDWFTVAQAARMTKRNASLIRRWLPRLPREHVAKGQAWPYPTLLSPDALILLSGAPNKEGKIEFPRRNRVIDPRAYRPAKVA